MSMITMSNSHPKEVKTYKGTSKWGPISLSISEIGLYRLYFNHQEGAIEDQATIDHWLNDPDLHVVGTDFQLNVYKELLKVSQLISYEELAERAHSKAAVRAVASAVANNPIPLFIPCHLIIYKSGAWGNYRYGKELKKQLILDHLK